MVKRALLMLALAVSLASTNLPARAQSKGDKALLDALVRKGVLTDKEAEEISAETAKEAVSTSVAKIQIGDWVGELKLSGDLRLRNQADQRTPMILTNPLLGPQDRNIDRDRWRFRLRLNADFKLAGNFFGGVQLATSDNRAADNKYATYTGGYDLYSIYISRAFMGWVPTPGLTFIAGKQANPYYTTDLIYDPDVDPQGLVERIDFPKLFNMTFGEAVAADGKEGKAAPPAPQPPGDSLEVSLIAGQFVFNNNNGDSGSTQLKWDSYQFQEQLFARLRIGDKLTITVAPGFLSFNDSSSGGTPGPHGTIIPPVAMTGQTFANGGTLNNSLPFPVTQRDLNIILAPCDITYNIFGKPLTVYWDFAYNFSGDDRFNRDYGPLFSHYFYVGRSATPSFNHRVQPSFSDNVAWLVGLKFGENKKEGDYSVSGEYRQVGISSIDPNLNSSDFALSNLNVGGWEFNLAYNFTDFLTGVFKLYYSEALTKNLYGGYATGNVPGTTNQFPIARDRHDMVFEADLLMKF
jgi:hypothetical protein